MEEYTTHESFFDQVSSLLGEYHGVTNTFGSVEPKDMNEESPLIKDAKKSWNTNFKADTRNKEHHDSPFYTVDENDDTVVAEEVAGDDADKGVPTAMFHGFGDACINPGDLQFNEQIRRATKAPVHCIEVGLPFVGEVLNNFETIA